MLTEHIPSYRKIWKISYPIILSLVAHNIVTAIDTAFLGRVGEVELGASAIGGLFYYALFMMGFGFGNGAQILMARRNGEKKFAAVGKIFDHTMYIFVAISIVIIVAISLGAPLLLKHTISSPEIMEAANDYLQYRVWGILFAFTNVAFRAYFVAITKTGLLGWGAIIMGVVNIVLDYALIFGNFGFEARGIEGAAIASIYAEAAAALFFIITTFTNRSNRKFPIFKFRTFEPAIIRNTWDISVYIMIQNFASLAGWFVFFIIIEQSGERPLAISNIIRSIYTFLMIHAWAFGSTVNTLVSNALGENKPEIVMPVIRKVNILSVLTSLGVLGLTYFVPEMIMRVYTNNPELIEGSAHIFRVIVFVLIPLSLGANYFSGVSGTGNTKTALIIELAVLALYFSYVITVNKIYNGNLAVIWLSEYVYMTMLGVVSYLYLKYGNWRKKRI
jgi:multidrug resistance protein, MATE family